MRISDWSSDVCSSDLLVLVGGGAVLGFARGLVQEVTSLLAWLLAILAVRFFHATLTGLLGDHVGAPGGAAMLAFALLFGGVFGIVHWGSRTMGPRSRAARAGGFEFGSASCRGRAVQSGKISVVA